MMHPPPPSDTAAPVTPDRTPDVDADDRIRIRDLDTRLLLAFRAVAVEGTFMRAATQLGYTQSAISQQIAALEKVLGAAVFDRPGGSRRVELTPLGTLLRRHTDDMLGVLEGIVADVQRLRSGDLGRIDVGTIQSVSTAMLPAVLRRLLAERPGLDTRVHERFEEADLVDGLLGGELDLTFLIDGHGPGIERIDLLTDPFVVLARPGDVDAGPVTIDRLAAGPLIGQTRGTCQDGVDAKLREVGCDPDYVFRSADNGVVVSMVRAGLGLALLPRLAVLDEFGDPRIAIRTLDPPIPARTIRLAWRTSGRLSTSAARFRDIAIDVAAELAHRHPILAPAESAVGAS